VETEESEKERKSNEERNTEGKDREEIRNGEKKVERK
jgi:hypothetical protein